MIQFQLQPIEERKSEQNPEIIVFKLSSAEKVGASKILEVVHKLKQ